MQVWAIWEPSQIQATWEEISGWGFGLNSALAMPNQAEQAKRLKINYLSQDLASNDNRRSNLKVD